jgi:hypothetical protein
MKIVTKFGYRCGELVLGPIQVGSLGVIHCSSILPDHTICCVAYRCLARNHTIAVPVTSRGIHDIRLTYGASEKLGMRECDV